jgi:hypothetical protein
MPNRTVCDALEEIRKAHKEHNYSYLMGLVEEIQTMANRMEAKLYTISDFEYLEKRIKELKAEEKKLREESK